MVGISTNMLARVFDLVPFIFIGFAVDYYSGISKSGGRLGDCLLYTSDAADE